MGDSVENLQRKVEELEQRVAALSGRLLADADRFQGRDVSAIAPSAGHLYAWNDSTKTWEPNAPGIPGAHVLASTAGLGAAHTVAGLTERQVLIATGATTALFRVLQDADIPASIARDSEITTDIATHAATEGAHHKAMKYQLWIPFALDTIPGLSFTP